MHTPVSIHTPTKGVTDSWRCNEVWDEFQSTHPRRVWPIYPPSILMLGSFNPHTHEGCDLRLLHLTYKRLSFNPHTHEGCDVLSALKILSLMVFQSTHPRRVWRSYLPYNSQTILFQSTHPRRVWLLVLALGFLPFKFQSTHPRRVWLAVLIFIFQFM